MKQQQEENQNDTTAKVTAIAVTCGILSCHCFDSLSPS